MCSEASQVRDLDQRVNSPSRSRMAMHGCLQPDSSFYEMPHTYHLDIRFIPNSLHGQLTLNANRN